MQRGHAEAGSIQHTCRPCRTERRMAGSAAVQRLNMDEGCWVTACSCERSKAGSDAHVQQRQAPASKRLTARNAYTVHPCISWSPSVNAQSAHARAFGDLNKRISCILYLAHEKVKEKTT